MEYHNPPKKSKRRSTLTLNKTGSRYYSHAKAEQSQTTSAACAESVLEMHHSLEATDLVQVMHPVDLSTNIFASQSEHSENFAALPHAPATTKYKKTFNHDLYLQEKSPSLLRQKLLHLQTKTFKLFVEILTITKTLCVIQISFTSFSSVFIIQSNWTISIDLCRICVMDTFHFITLRGKAHFK